MSTTNGKDIVYIDIDEEITSLIDKVRSSGERIVALVLPKRATVLQSIVNMKLLKRTADEAKKHVVLITSETGLLPLAGNVGLYVARNLQTKPEIPPAPHTGGAADAEEIAADEPLNMDEADKVDVSKPVGDLTKHAPKSVANYTALPDDEPIELDNATPAEAPARAAAAKSPKGKKGKKFKVPDFNKFRAKLLIGGLVLMALILIWIFAAVVLPHATIAIKTDSSALDANLNLTLLTSGGTLDAKNGSLPATSQQVQKTLTGQADATGQQNNGQKATGSVTITNCSGGDVNLPAGTGFSAGGLTFISNSAVSVPQSNYKLSGGSFTCKNDGTASVNVTAQNGGANYNVGPQGYAIANNPTNLTAKGSPMNGGTDNITKVVQQSDIDGAKQKISSQDTSSIKQQLQQQLQNQGLYAIAATFNAGSPDVSNSANVGSQASSVTVTEKLTYTMLGVSKNDLQKVIAASIDQQIDTSKQSILDYGLDGASFSVKGDSTQLSMSASVVVGSDINVATIKQQVAGKKSGDAQNIIKTYPGVTDVQVHYSPFWVSSIPKSTSKITVQIAKPKASNAKQ